MAIGPNLRRLHMMNRMMQSAGRIGGSARQGFNAARALGAEARRFISPQEKYAAQRARQARLQMDEATLQRRENLRESIEEQKKIRQEQEKLFKQLMDAMGIHGRLNILRARNDRRLLGMVKVIHSIFGNSLSKIELANVNKILRKNLSPKSEVLQSSPQLKIAIEIIRTGKPKIQVEQAFEVLTQTSMDILQNNKIGQRILENHGIGTE